MSEFIFPCPACGQNISCDPAHAGTEIICPLCHANVIAPQETVKETIMPAEVPVETDAPPPWTGYNATTVETTRRTSRVAIASLICSLSSLITCIGWLPGIICGHLAKSRIRRNPSLKGGNFATAGLIIGYSIILLETGMAGTYICRLSNAMKQGWKNVSQELATNPVVVTTTQSGVTNATDPMQVTTTTNTQPADVGWLADLNGVAFPDHPVSGKIHGHDFNFRTALFKNGGLKISAADGMYVEIPHGLGAAIEGQSYDFKPDDDGADPHVKLGWQDDAVVQSATFSKGYSLKLQFGNIVKRKISAKIYLCLPDDSKSYLAGQFEVRIAKTKP
jgi:Domain of unknown function (DUF4190)